MLPSPVHNLVALDLLAAGSALALACAPPACTRLLADPDALALALAWVVALAAALHLTLTLTWCLVAVRRGQPAVARRRSARLPRALRPWVELALAGSLATVSAGSARAAAAGTPVVRVTIVAADVPVVRAPEPVRPGARAAALPRRHVVQPGDNLWRIARGELASAGRPAARASDIAPYWQRVVAVNRPTLRSGNPNLIFPGEIVTLPPIL